MYNNVLSSHTFLSLLILIYQEINEVTLKPSWHVVQNFYTKLLDSHDSNSILF